MKKIHTCGRRPVILLISVRPCQAVDRFIRFFGLRVTYDRVGGGA